MRLRAWMLIVLMVSLAIVIVAPLAAQQSRAFTLPADLSGTYQASGDSPTGPYTATAAVQKHEATYAVRWSFSQGGMVGVGFIDGDTFVVGFFGEQLGVVRYRVTRSDPLTLEGLWTSWGFGSIHPERLVWSGAVPQPATTSPGGQRVGP